MIATDAPHKKAGNWKKQITCLREIGKVNFPENSGRWTISWHISLHERQTAAHATTCLRAGHVLSLASNLLITSRSNSGGRLAQQLLWMTIAWSCNSWTALWDFPLLWLDSLTSKLRLDKLPILSLISRAILRKDIYWTRARFHRLLSICESFGVTDLNPRQPCTLNIPEEGVGYQFKLFCIP